MKEFFAAIFAWFGESASQLTELSRIRKDETILRQKKFLSITKAMIVCGASLYAPFLIYQKMSLFFAKEGGESGSATQSFFADFIQVAYGVSLVLGGFVIMAMLLPIRRSLVDYKRTPQYVLYLFTAYLVWPTWLLYGSLLFGAVARFYSKEILNSNPQGFFILTIVSIVLGITVFLWTIISTIAAAKGYARLTQYGGTVFGKGYLYGLFFVYPFIPYLVGLGLKKLGLVS